MREDSLTAIAQKLHISKTTVSKAVRHCSGVDSETRNLVLREIKKSGYCCESACPIYCILPDVPKYFWKEALRGIAAGELPGKVPVKYNIFTRPSDEETVLSYLDEAEKSGAKAIIIAANMTLRIRERLEALQENRMILLLSEHASIRNCFFIGADSFRDGYQMGKVFLENYRDRRLFLFSITDNANARKREEGFMRAVLESEQDRKFEKIEISNACISGEKMFPARLASMLAPIAGDGGLCFYSPVGMNGLPLAIHKAGLKEKAVLLCHDCYSEYQEDGQKRYGGFSVICSQDVFAQGLAAVGAANRYAVYLEYPENKETFIDSHICREI